MHSGNLVFIVLTLISFAGLYKIFEKAGEKGWKGLIPFYNFYVWIRLLENPWWWIFLMIVPGVNILMYSVLTFQTARWFGKRNFAPLFFASFFFFSIPSLFRFYINRKMERN